MSFNYKIEDLAKGDLVQIEYVYRNSIEILWVEVNSYEDNLVNGWADHFAPGIEFEQEVKFYFSQILELSEDTKSRIRKNKIKTILHMLED